MIRYIAQDAGQGPHPGHHREGFAYRIAGHALWSRVRLQALSDYARPGPAPAAPDPPTPLIESDAPAVTVTGWLAGATRQVTCTSGQAAFALDLGDLARVVVARDGAGIFCTQVSADLAPAVLEEALLGPPITFALALHGVFCLHASALLRGDRALLFLGASGQGKSTLAAHCRQTPGAGLRRIADDICPCALVAGQPCARPQFPQLKLTPTERYPRDAPQDVPIAALVVLQPDRDPGVIALEPLPVTTAVKALADQTVAVGLFDRALHQAHLRFLAALLRVVPIYRLRYPHDYGQLSAVYRALAGL